MTMQPPLWAGGATYPAAADRGLLSALFANAGVVTLATDLKVTQRGAGANMSVDVAAGSALIDGTDAAGQGRYFCQSTSTVNKVVNAAPGAGTSRIDRIYARIADADILGGSSSWDVFYIAGTAAASPSPPALPSSSIPLAQFTVLSSTTSITSGMITDQRTLADSLSGLGALFSAAPDYSSTTTFTTPTGNFILGGGTKTANFYKLGRLVVGWCFFQLGASGNITAGADIAISLPFVNTGAHRGFAAARARQNSGLVVSGTAAISAGGSTVVNFVMAGLSAVWGSTVPFNWDPGDSLDAIIVYEAAS
jgi:hypothetical protein